MAILISSKLVVFISVCSLLETQVQSQHGSAGTPRADQGQERFPEHQSFFCLFTFGTLFLRTVAVKLEDPKFLWQFRKPNGKNVCTMNHIMEIPEQKAL